MFFLTKQLNKEYTESKNRLLLEITKISINFREIKIFLLRAICFLFLQSYMVSVSLIFFVFVLNFHNLSRIRFYKTLPVSTNPRRHLTYTVSKSSKDMPSNMLSITVPHYLHSFKRLLTKFRWWLIKNWRLLSDLISPNVRIFYF